MINPKIRRVYLVLFPRSISHFAALSAFLASTNSNMPWDQTEVEMLPCLATK